VTASRRSCVAGLLRAGGIRVQPEGSAEITGFREAGVRDLFEKDLVFKRANIFSAGDDDIGVPARNRICQFVEERLGHPLPDRENTAIADATLDGFLSRGSAPLIRPVDLRLSSRELTTEADVEALLAEIRAELMAQIEAGSRVRIVCRGFGRCLQPPLSPKFRRLILINTGKYLQFSRFWKMESMLGACNSSPRISSLF